jgi:hypothetical protein
MFFMKSKPKFSQAERDEMIAFISRPTGSRSESVRMIRMVEGSGMGVPCPKFFMSRNPAESGNGPYVS